MVELKDGPSVWVPLKDLNDTNTNPIELAEYAVGNKISSEEPVFAWWVIPYCLSKSNRIINKIKSKYSRTMYKYGVKLLRTAEEALRLDRINGNHYWEKAIKKEMGKMRVAYEARDHLTPEQVRKGKAPKLTGYQEITCHLVFNLKLKMDFAQKTSCVLNGLKTDTPSSFTYSSVVSRDSVRLAFLLAALNDLDIMSCDIGNAYLNAPCREKYGFEQD